MIDLRPQYRQLSPEDFYQSGSDPVAQFLSSGERGFERGQQASQVLAQRRRKQVLAQNLQKYLQASPNPQHNLLAQLINEDTAEPIATKIAQEVEKPNNSGPTRNLYQDPSTHLFGETPIDGASPFVVPDKAAMSILAGQNKQDSIQSRLDEMIKARESADKIRSDQMRKNRILRAIIAQKGFNFKTDKANMDNVVKRLAGFGIDVSPEDIMSTYQEFIGDLPDEDAGSGGKSSKPRVKVSNFTVTP